MLPIIIINSRMLNVKEASELILSDADPLLKDLIAARAPQSRHLINEINK